MGSLTAGLRGKGGCFGDRTALPSEVVAKTSFPTMQKRRRNLCHALENSVWAQGLKWQVVLYNVSVSVGQGWKN